MTDITVEVEHGTIHIEYVDLILRTEDVWVMEIGTVEKYPEVGGYSRSKVYIWPSERTPGVEGNDTPFDPATVRFPQQVRGWDLLPEITGRYSLRVAFWRNPGPEARVELWRKDEAQQTA